MDFAEITTIVALLASALGLIAVLRDVWSRLTQVRIGAIEFEPIGEPREIGRSAQQVAIEMQHELAALSMFSTSQYALDPATRASIDAKLRDLERRLATFSDATPPDPGASG